MAEGPGLFLSVEGIDGAGKSTQVASLAGAVGRAGHQLTLVREPGGTDLGESVRDLVLHRRYEGGLDHWSETLLMVAARAQLLAEVVRPALARGDVVIADRFVDSTLAYQGGGRGLEIEALRRLHRDTCGDLWPRLTILLSLPAGIAAERRQSSRLPLDRMEADGESGMLARVADAYSVIAAADPDRIVPIDASRDPAAVARDVWSAVAPRLLALPAVAR